MNRRVVITGMGVVSSLSCQVEDLWQKILSGQSGIHLLRLFDVSDFKVKIGGDILDWEPSQYIPPKDMKRVARFSQFALVAGAEAVKQSGLDFSQEDTYRCGCILGSGIGGIREVEFQTARLMDKGPSRVSAMTVPRLMLNAGGCNLSIEYNLQGPNFSISTACASATNAMCDALKSIRLNEADVILTGGTEAAMCRVSLAAFQNIKALSDSNDDPSGASRPFDLDRNGFVFSEGAGVLVFEELEHAKARGANILCEVLGYGASTDAGHITQPDENGIGAARAMSNSLTDAGLNPEQVDYINAHGTSTPLGDLAETKAVKSVFGSHAHQVSISSTKSQLGHTLGASGGIELVLSVQAVNNNVVPPTINLNTPDPDCDLDYTPNTPRERTVDVAMSNSFGFGGHNASIVIGTLRNGQA